MNVTMRQNEVPLTPFSIDHFEWAAREAIDDIPLHLREKLSDVIVQIEEFATEEQLHSVGLSNQWDLSGLYEGVPLTEQAERATGQMPAIIRLFRQPLLAEMRATGIGFKELVRHVVIHEAGHHFGFSDDEMHALEEAADPAH